jgi:hypothetical protein
MAGTTYNELYTSLKDNEVLINYNKGGDLGVLGIRSTLKSDLVPVSDSLVYEHVIWTGEKELGNTFIGSDSDQQRYTNFFTLNTPEFTAPDWIKVYSTNYNAWINIEIAKIESVQVAGV